MDAGNEPVSGTESLVRDQADALAARSAGLQALPDIEQQAITEATATVLQFLASSLSRRAAALPPTSPARWPSPSSCGA